MSGRSSLNEDGYCIRASLAHVSMYGREKKRSRVRASTDEAFSNAR